jgi:hypothetical protein
VQWDVLYAVLSTWVGWEYMTCTNLAGPFAYVGYGLRGGIRSGLGLAPHFRATRRTSNFLLLPLKSL